MRTASTELCPDVNTMLGKVELAHAGLVWLITLDCTENPATVGCARGLTTARDEAGIR